MSRHSYDSSCQLDLHKMLHKTVLFYDDKLVKSSLKHEKKINISSEENTTLVQNIMLKLHGNKQKRHFFFLSRLWVLNTKKKKSLLVPCLSLEQTAVCVVYSLLVFTEKNDQKDVATACGSQLQVQKKRRLQEGRW